ncbi:hypothetical protein BJ742DRAFT_854576 [Cladochytrium replicatum]|nr:hypothetical protein BJ742DRAFT_854576 [Cladochytrium replicatum]
MALAYFAPVFKRARLLLAPISTAYPCITNIELKCEPRKIPKHLPYVVNLNAVGIASITNDSSLLFAMFFGWIAGLIWMKFPLLAIEQYALRGWCRLHRRRPVFSE